MVTRRGEFLALPHISGPCAVLVSLKFGQAPESGPVVVCLEPIGPGPKEIRFDLVRHLREIGEGVAAANVEFGGDLQITAVEVVPDDYPGRGQAQTTAYRIARAVLRNEI